MNTVDVKFKYYNFNFLSIDNYSHVCVYMCIIHLIFNYLIELNN